MLGKKKRMRKSNSFSHEVISTTVVNDNNKIRRAKKLAQKKAAQKKKKQQDKINVNHLVYQGTNFYYGKSNIQNDFLTFKFANKKNWWFHIGDGSGAHVICDADELNEPLLRFGANLAAFYSKYQLSSSVKVNYTQVKHLKKIPQSNMGMVAMNEHKTIYIDPQDPTVFKLWDE